MSIFESLILGIVQGITEFLPVSSTGHLEIFKLLFDAHIKEDMLFTLVVHLGTAIPTFLIFRKEAIQIIKAVLKNLTRKELTDEEKYSSKFGYLILIGSIPILLAKIFFEDEIESSFAGGKLYLSISLIITAALLLASYYIPNKFLKNKETKPLGIVNSFIIGIAQALAIVPAISRSGATISTALIMKIDREEAAKYSFLMVLVPIFGASLIEVFSSSNSTISVESIDVLLIGFLSSMIVGWLSLIFMVKIVKRSKMHYFAPYTLLLAVIVLFL